MAEAKFTTGPTAAQALFKAMCRQHGLPEPVPEYQFHEERKWRFDKF